MMDCVYNPTLKSPYTKDKVNNPPIGNMRDYRQNPPTVEDIYTHLLFTVPSGYNLHLY